VHFSSIVSSNLKSGSNFIVLSRIKLSKELSFNPNSKFIKLFIISAKKIGRTLRTIHKLPSYLCSLLHHEVFFIYKVGAHSVSKRVSYSAPQTIKETIKILIGKFRSCFDPLFYQAVLNAGVTLSIQGYKTTKVLYLFFYGLIWANEGYIRGGGSYCVGSYFHGRRRWGCSPFVLKYLQSLQIISKLFTINLEWF